MSNFTTSQGRGWLSTWMSRLMPSGTAAAERRFKVVNLSRQTELGDRIETADYGPQRRKGLLGRAGLASGEGLWIVPCEAVHTFGMRFPIDLVYLDRKRRVVKTRQHVVPGRLSACLRAHSIIELPSGAVRQARVERGDQLQIEPA